MRSLNVRTLLIATTAGVFGVQMLGVAAPCPPGEENEQKVVSTVAYVQDKGVYKFVDTTVTKANTIVLRSDKDGRLVEVRVQPLDLSKKAYVLAADTISIADVRGKAIGNFVVTGKGNVAFRVATAVKAPSVQIGLVTEAVSKALAGHLKIRPEEALIVTGVLEGLPAAKAGIKEHDIIVRVEGVKAVTHVNLKAVLSNCKPDQVIAVRVLRDGEPKDVKIRVKVVEPRDYSVTTVYDTRLNLAKPLTGTYSFVRPQISAVVTDIRPELLATLAESQRAQTFLTIDPKISTQVLKVEPRVQLYGQVALPYRQLVLADAYSQLTKGAQGKSIEARLLVELGVLEQQLTKLRALISELDATSKNEDE